MTNLQPGPEMDAAVARALGHVIRTDSLGQYIILPRSVISRPPWKWSTDDACAVRDVLPEIERLGLGVVISTHGRPHCIISDGKTGGFETQWIFADKLAHAICAAFLEAVEKTT